MSGYVRIHRPLFEEHPAFRNDMEAMAFAWMIVKAQWRPRTVRYKGHNLRLQRGQLAVSQRDMADHLDRDKAWVERLWRRLKTEAMIDVDVRQGVAVITICNYSEYQADIATPEAADEAPLEADVRQPRGTEQRSEEEKNSSVAKATSLRPWACPVGVDPQVWTDLLSNRKRKRAGNTPTSWKKFQDDLARVALKTGIPPPKLIEHAAANGWAGIYDPNERSFGNERTDSNPLGTALQRVAGALSANG